MKTSFIFFCLLMTLSLTAQEWQIGRDLPGNASDRNHPVTFAIDGVGYLATGGDNFSNNYNNDVYKFIAGANTWVELNPFPGSARSFAYGVSHEGKGYLGFGFNGASALRDLWEYDPENDEWTQLATCPCEARLHPAMIANNGEIHVGLGGGNGNLKDWWVYTIATDTWEQKPDFPGLRRHHPYQFAIGDYVYAGMGHGAGIYNDLYRFDSSTDTWEQMATLPSEGRVAGTQFDYNGKGYVLSGQGDDHDYLEEGEFWEYDPETNSWEQLPPHLGNRGRWAPGSFVIGSKVYMMAGEPAFGDDTETLVFDLDFDIDTGTEEPTFLSLNTYPNPVTTDLFLELEEKIENIQVFNYLGQELKVSLNSQRSMDVSQLPNGWYEVVIYTVDNKYKATFVKG